MVSRIIDFSQGPQMKLTHRTSSRKGGTNGQWIGTFVAEDTLKANLQMNQALGGILDSRRLSTTPSLLISLHPQSAARRLKTPRNAHITTRTFPSKPHLMQKTLSRRFTMLSRPKRCKPRLIREALSSL